MRGMLQSPIVFIFYFQSKSSTAMHREALQTAPGSWLAAQLIQTSPLAQVLSMFAMKTSACRPVGRRFE